MRSLNNDSVVNKREFPEGTPVGLTSSRASGTPAAGVTAVAIDPLMNGATLGARWSALASKRVGAWDSFWEFVIFQLCVLASKWTYT